MPKMNGRELVAELVKSMPALRVVFASGYPEEILTDARDGARASIGSRSLFLWRIWPGRYGRCWTSLSLK